jgi:hypothetical protein
MVCKPFEPADTKNGNGNGLKQTEKVGALKFERCVSFRGRAGPRLEDLKCAHGNSVKEKESDIFGMNGQTGSGENWART